MARDACSVKCIEAAGDEVRQEGTWARTLCIMQVNSHVVLERGQEAIASRVWLSG